MCLFPLEEYVQQETFTGHGPGKLHIIYQKVPENALIQMKKCNAEHTIMEAT